MYCTKCGSVLSESAKFCSKCGAEISRRVDAVELSSNHVENEVIYKENKPSITRQKKGKKKTVISIVTILVLIALSCSLCMNGSKSEEAEIIDIDSIDILYDNNEYVGKRVRVTGSVNIFDASIMDMKMYGEDSPVELYLEGSEAYEIPDTWCVTVVGIVKINDYDVPYITVEQLEACTDENCEHNEIYYEPSISDAISVTYEDLARYPDTYMGTNICVTGKVLDAMHGDYESNFSMYVNGDTGSLVDVVYDSGLLDHRVLSGDIITVYGIYEGVDDSIIIETPNIRAYYLEY